MSTLTKLRNLFKKPAPAPTAQKEEEPDRRQERLASSLSMLEGKRVLVINNTDEPWVGTLRGLDERFGKPVVEADDGTIYHVGGVVVPYSVETEAWVRSLGLKRGWEVFFGMAYFHNELRAAQRFHRELNT